MYVVSIAHMHKDLFWQNFNHWLLEMTTSNAANDENFYSSNCYRGRIKDSVLSYSGTNVWKFNSIYYFTALCFMPYNRFHITYTGKPPYKRVIFLQEAHKKISVAHLNLDVRNVIHVYFSLPCHMQHCVIISHVIRRIDSYNLYTPRYHYETFMTWCIW